MTAKAFCPRNQPAASPLQRCLSRCSCLLVLLAFSLRLFLVIAAADPQALLFCKTEVSRDAPCDAVGPPPRHRQTDQPPRLAFAAAASLQEPLHLGSFRPQAPDPHNFRPLITSGSVMAEQTVQDVVNGTQSTGAPPVDISGHTQLSAAVAQSGNGVPASSASSDKPNVDASTLSTSPRSSDFAIRPDSTDPQAPANPAAQDLSNDGRERANSFKKPKTFQSVSVTKTFLGKVASEAQRGADKVVEGPPSAARASPQPLVQKKTLNLKTGSSSRIATTRATIPATGPDAAKVWNRNQYVAPPPPKQFTDEELKQQYGIHMATRLQADEPGTQSKWADIDDDDDNWVPEGVMEWTDGTKSTVAPSKASPEPTAQPQDPEPQLPAQSNTENKHSEEASIPSAGKTILRPGIRATSSAAGKPGLVLRGQPENANGPSSGAPPATSGRSPWAALPPVDKASPVAFVPPAQSLQQAHRTRRPSQDYDLPAPYQPTRELAADDFSRWADGERHSKELYNSQSGRYEPVKTEGRRASLRADGYRRPSVLQRPSASNGSHPDPASAFQSRRGDVRIDDEVIELQNNDNAVVATPNSTSTDQLPQADPTTEAPAAPLGAPAAAAQPVRSAEEERAEQNRLMKERVELNRRRKLAETEREEEARKERIRLKMKALDAQREKEAKAAAPPERRQPPEDASHPTPRQTHPSPPASRLSEEAVQPFSAKPLSDPLPPSESHLTPPKSPRVVLAPPPVSSSVHDVANPPVQRSHVSGSPSPRALESDAASWTQLANRHPPSSAGWAGPGLPGQASNAGNVWGPPSNDRTLGNGVFESGTPNLQRSPNRSLQRSGPPPGPIGPPSTSPRMPTEASQFQAAPPSSMGPMKLSANASGAGARYGQASKPRPKTDLSAVTRAWGNVQNALAQGEVDRKARMAAREAELAMNPDAPESVPVFNVMFRKTENGRPSSHVQHLVLDENRSRLGDSEPGFVAAPPGPLAPQSAAQAPIGSMPGAQPAHQSRFFGPKTQTVHPPNMAAAYLGRGRRSSSPPPPEQGQHPAYYSGAAPRPRVNFPPGKPVVRLPPQRSGERSIPLGSQVVTAHRAASSTFGTAPPIGWQDRFNDLLGRPAQAITAVAAQIAAQERPMATPSPAIASASRVPFEAAAARHGATVSLPREKGRVTFALPDTFVESKPTEEEMMEDRGFGSLPTVSLPSELAPLEPVVIRRGGGKVAHAEKSFSFGSTADVKEVESLLESQQGSQISVVVHLLGKPEVVKTIARKAESAMKKRRSIDKRKVSASGSAHASEANSLGSPVQHSPPNEKENGERRSKWAKPAKGPPRKGRFEQPTSPAGLARDATSKPLGGGPVEAGGQRVDEARKKNTWPKPAKRLSAPVP